jgi:tetratricopeptide (TPR) repeat protein
VARFTFGGWKLAPAARLAFTYMRLTHKLIALTILAIGALLLCPANYYELAAIKTIAASATEDSNSFQVLKTNSAIKREIRGGELHSYALEVDVNDYVRILIAQQGIEAEVTVASSEGRVYSKVNCRHREPTPVSVVSESGTLKISVRSTESKDVSGDYELKVVETRESKESDKRHIAAEALFARAEDLRKKGDAESNRNSIANYEEALSLWRALGDQNEVAHALKHIGDVHQSFYEMKAALSFYTQALALFRKLKNLRGESETLNETSNVYAILGNQRRALQDNARVMKIAEAKNDRVALAQALNNMGEIKYWSGDLTQALTFYRKALAIWSDLKDRRGQAQSYTYLGYSSSDLAQTKAAFDFYRNALTLWNAVGDERGKAVTLTAIGRLYSRVGESQTALDFFQKAMPLSSRIGNKVEEARVLTGMAYVFGRLGEEQKALDLYEKARQLFADANYIDGEASTVYSAGRVYYSMGNTEKALEYHLRALESCRIIGDQRLEIIILIEIGRLHQSSGDHSAAIKNFLLARDFAHAQKDLRAEMDAWNLLGVSYEVRQGKKKALTCYERALALSRAAEFGFGESAMLYQIARTQRDLGDIASARTQIESAIRIIESLRTKVASQELRASYFASVRQLYELYIDLLMDLNNKNPGQGFDVLAFEASEQGRARSLLEMLAAARVGVRDKVEPQLLQREQVLREELSEKVRQLEVETASGVKTEKPELVTEIDELTDRYQEANAVVRAASLEHTDQAQPTPLSLKEIRDQVLSRDAALLAFSLGEKRSFLWLVTKDNFTSCELPPRQQIEESAREIRELLMAPLTTGGEAFEVRQKRLHDAEEEYWKKSTLFSNMLLGQVALNLASNKLLIIPDGDLQYLPFSALPIPLRNDRTPLLVEHEITFQPSASALSTLKRKAIPDASKGVAIFADPVFGLDDQRFAAKRKEGVTLASVHDPQMVQALRDVNVNLEQGSSIPRLVASRQEAEGIVNVMASTDNLKAIGFEADKQRVTASDLSKYRIVHFATHGVLDNKNPELSGLVLSRLDEEGREGGLSAFRRYL